MNIKSNLLLALVIGGSFMAAQELNAAEEKPKHSALECEVWNREKSFAMSVENHDAKAFIEHVDANAVFVSGNGSYTRGSVEVAKTWAGIIEGKEIILRWSPDFVGISSDGKTAISRGPFWIEDPEPSGKQKFLIGTFQSTWIKNGKGQWHVFLDGGTPRPVPATLEQVEALKKSLSPTCAQ